MNNDETAPPFQPQDTPATTTKTETKIETIETEVPGHRVRRPGELFGMSGRFWISMIALAGFIWLCHSFGRALVESIESGKDLTSATTFLGMIFSAYAAAVTTILGNYMGQNSGPTKAKPS